MGRGMIGDMGNGANLARERGKLPKGVKAGDLSPEDIARINAERSPSDRIGAQTLCGAKMSSKVIEKKREKLGHDEFPKTCQNVAGMGTNHPGVGYCKFHGGSTPAGKKNAARLYGESLIEKQRAEIAKFGGDRTLVTITPEEALLEEVRRSVAMVRWLEERIGSWQFKPLETPDPNDPRLDPESPNFDPNYRPAQPALGGLPALIDETWKGNPINTNEREWLDLYRREREHAIKVSKMAIDAGIAQRMVSIAEDQARMLAVAIRATLDALNLTPDQVALVPRVVPTILRQVTQGVKPVVDIQAPTPGVAVTP